MDTGISGVVKRLGRDSDASRPDVGPTAAVLESRRTGAVAWFAVVVFAYYYKGAVCGFLGDDVGLKCLCGTTIRGISTNHWFEILVYCPLLWLALHQVNVDVFGDLPRDPAARRSHQRRQLVGEFAITLVIYGTGIHIANVIEIYSREGQAIESGAVYDLVYFLDEGLSHYVQFIPLFFVIGWFIIQDRPRPEHAALALFLGVGHGVERTVGIIEGSKWYLGPPTVLWLALAAYIRVRKLREGGRPPLDDFFVRYALGFCLALPLAQAGYVAWHGSFVSPSTLSDAQTEVIAVGVGVMTLGGTWLLAFSERWWNPRHVRASAGGRRPGAVARGELRRMSR